MHIFYFAKCAFEFVKKVSLNEKMISIGAAPITKNDRMRKKYFFSGKTYMYLIDVFDPNRKVVLVSDISRQKVLLPMLQVFLYLCSDLRLRMGYC